MLKAERFCLSGNPYTLVRKDSWTAASSGHYKDEDRWHSKHMVDDNLWTYYCSKTEDYYHWLQIDFSKTIQVSLALLLLAFVALFNLQGASLMLEELRNPKAHQGLSRLLRD